MLKSKLLRAVACAGAVFLMAVTHAQAADCGNNGSGFSGFIKAFHKEAAAQGIGREAHHQERPGPECFLPKLS